VLPPCTTRTPHTPQGNNGQRGSLICTNLRIIWVSNTNSAVNLSIGYDTIASLNIKKAISKLRGSTQALSCISKFKNSRSVLVAIAVAITHHHHYHHHEHESSNVQTRHLTPLILTLTHVIHRFEFIFTSLVKNSPRLFTTVQTVLKAYETSRMFRDLKVRAACIVGKTGPIS